MKRIGIDAIFVAAQIAISMLSPEIYFDNWKDLIIAPLGSFLLGVLWIITLCKVIKASNIWVFAFDLVLATVLIITIYDCYSLSHRKYVYENYSTIVPPSIFIGLIFMLGPYLLALSLAIFTKRLLDKKKTA